MPTALRDSVRLDVRSEYASQEPVTVPLGTLNSEEQSVLASAPRFLNRALQLKQWFTAADRANAFDQRFDLTRSLHRSEISYAFFSRVRMSDGSVLPVMGAAEDMFYDQTRTPSDRRSVDAAWMNQQVREFVLRYFLRVSSFRLPEPSWQDQSQVTREGLGYRQLFCKPRGRDTLRFAPDAQQAMVDVREIGPTYDWTLAKVKIYNFAFNVPLPGAAPELRFELDEDSYLVLAPEFTVDLDHPSPGVLGEYGVGYAFVHNPGPSALAYGPGEFDAAYKTFRFRVFDTGEVQVRMEFVANRPTAALRVSLNPLKWGVALTNLASFGWSSRLLDPVMSQLDRLPGAPTEFDPVYPAIDLANLLTAGYAGRVWGISRDNLDRLFLLQHYRQHYQTVIGSLLTWRQIPDWLDTRNLPNWVVSGSSS